jgi:hypothetical protein
LGQPSVSIVAAVIVEMVKHHLLLPHHQHRRRRLYLVLEMGIRGDVNVDIEQIN